MRLGILFLDDRAGIAVKRKCAIAHLRMCQPNSSLPRSAISGMTTQLAQRYAVKFNSFAAVRPRMSALSSSLSGSENMVDGLQLVAAQHDLTGADLGHQMAERFG